MRERVDPRHKAFLRCVEVEVLDQDTLLSLLAGVQLAQNLGQNSVQRIGVPFLPHQLMQNRLFLCIVVSEGLEEKLRCELLVGVGVVDSEC